jgi:ankyrin repeat protein
MGLFSTSKNSFLRAVKRGDLDVVQKCMASPDKAAYLAAIDEHGYLAPHLAAMEGNTDILEELLEAGAPVNARTHSKETPLHVAAGSYSRNTAVIDLLVRKGADLTATDNGGRTPLFLAAQNHLGEAFVKTLLAAGAPPDARSLLAAAERSEESMLALIQKGAKPEAVDTYGRNALHIAVSRNYQRAADLMIEQGADIDARDTYYGYTTLHWAINGGHPLMVEKLLDKGADTALRNNQGKTALEYAYERQNGVIAQMIEQRTAPAPAAPALKDDGEQWVKLGEDRVAYVGTFPAIGRRLTEIFNFAGRERTSISENLKTGQETTGAPQSFDQLDEATLQRAMEAYKALGGKPDATHIFGSRLGKNLKA